MEKYILTTKDEHGYEQVVCRGTDRNSLRHVGEVFSNYELYEVKLLESNLNTGK